MKCRYCNITLAPLRSLTDGEFCSDEHRQAFQLQNGAKTDKDPAPAAPPRAAAPPNPQRAHPGEPLPPNQATPNQPSQNLVAFDFMTALAHLPEKRGEGGDSASEPSRPELPYAAAENAAPIDSAPPPSAATFAEAAPEPAALRSEETGRVAAQAPSAAKPASEQDRAGSEGRQGWLSSLQWIALAWSKAPRDLRAVTVLVPILLALVIVPSIPKVKVKVSSATANNVQRIVAAQWKDLHQTISNRAAVAFADDFRSGLDAWTSRSNLTRSWSYDAAGFVHPGPLALFKPTLEMSDYRFEFLEEIDQRAMGCAFRASDLDNYYAVKLNVVRPGPLPVVHLVRYAVINGKEIGRVEKPLPFTTRSDTLYRMLLDVRGSDFTIMVQGQVVDFWTDNRLRRGGIGFFCGKGERARLRWVEVSHQYDALGRLCAYLAPYGIEGRNGSVN
jgi:hypothetical protein